MNLKQINELKQKEYFKERGYKVYGEGSCRDMIVSCLTYGTSKEEFMNKYAHNYVRTREYFTDQQTGKKKSHIEGFCNTLEEVGLIWDDQENYFKNHCNVNCGTYADDEGCIYNSITEY